MLKGSDSSGCFDPWTFPAGGAQPRPLPQAVLLRGTMTLHPQESSPRGLWAFLLLLPRPLGSPGTLHQPPACLPAHPQPYSSWKPWPGFYGESLGWGSQGTVRVSAWGKGSRLPVPTLLSFPKLATHRAGREARGILPPAAADGPPGDPKCCAGRLFDPTSRSPPSSFHWMKRFLRPGSKTERRPRCQAVQIRL